MPSRLALKAPLEGAIVDSMMLMANHSLRAPNTSCHSGMGLLAEGRNPYSQLWLWIPGSLASLAPRNDGIVWSRALFRKIPAERLAQLDLAQFAGRRHRHFIEYPNQLRHLEAAEVLAAMF